MPDAEAVEAYLREVLARLLGRDPGEVRRVPAKTKLLGGGLDLGSLDGAALLEAVRQRYGVDVAALDLSLDSLESIASLRDFIVHAGRS